MNIVSLPGDTKSSGIHSLLFSFALGQSGTSWRSIGCIFPQPPHFSARTLMLTINSNKGLSETQLTVGRPAELSGGG